MSNEELTQVVQGLSRLYFNKEFLHTASFNKRLRTTGGRYLLRTHNIEVNPKYLDQWGLGEVEGIIKHELCHYHLHLEGRGYKHGDREFKDLLKETNSPRFCQPLESAGYIYFCTKCGFEYRRKRKLNVSKYCCSKCSGAILKKH